jgi:hypothetical protein
LNPKAGGLATATLEWVLTDADAVVRRTLEEVEENKKRGLASSVTAKAYVSRGHALHETTKAVPLPQILSTPTPPVPFLFFT